MITTQAGSFESDSPFQRRAWDRGFSGISVSRSEGGRSVVVGTEARARVKVKQFSSSGAEPYVTPQVPAV